MLKIYTVKRMLDKLYGVAYVRHPSLFFIKSVTLTCLIVWGMLWITS